MSSICEHVPCSARTEGGEFSIGCMRRGPGRFCLSCAVAVLGCFLCAFLLALLSLGYVIVCSCSLEMFGIICVVQLQFWSFSGGGGYATMQFLEGFSECWRSVFVEGSWKGSLAVAKFARSEMHIGSAMGSQCSHGGCRVWVRQKAPTVFFQQLQLLNSTPNLNSTPKFWEPLDHLQGSLGPSAPETPKKSEKNLPCPPAQKYLW